MVKKNHRKLKKRNHRHKENAVIIYTYHFCKCGEMLSFGVNDGTNDRVIIGKDNNKF